ncbi:Vacuolar protein sorting-associated protein [Parasponia andersonii]|uniref:Vacuolar protein sorting-associated protein n=1 Tax=Parasponia andersonii TaxID=3476 RepID=A0A2P5CC49_PARAD|nr:Vacuolar protein sorting-associated protein [Parasponia andersonii]
MLDGILGRGFSSKCKSLIKLTKTRIDVIRRKRNATQKFLKKDVADLLANGFDIDAYGRAEGLLVEVIRSSCYDFVERCCDLVLTHLSTMQKQRECPEECRAAVASLMFAAARFSDLPELRDLRQMFYERYGSSLDLFRNDEFVDNLASKPSTLENKVRLMKEIAVECSIKWDSRAFKQRMNKPSTSPQDPPKAHRPFQLSDDKSNSNNGKDKVLKANKRGLLFNERFDPNDGHKSRNGKDSSVSKMDAVGFQTRPSGNGYNSHNGWEETIMKKDSHDNLFQGRREPGPDKQVALNLEDATPKTVWSGSSSQRKRLEPTDAAAKLKYVKEKKIPIPDNQDTLLDASPDLANPHVKSSGKVKYADDNFGGQHITASCASKDEVKPKLKPYYNSAVSLPPPYVKRNDKAQNGKHVVHLESSDDGFDGNSVLEDSSTHDRANAGHMSVVQRGSDHSDHERHIGGSERVNLHDIEKDGMYPNDVTGNPIPKPRSSRRRHSKSRSGQSDAGHFEDAGALPRKSRSKRRDDSRRGLQLLFDDEHRRTDEEERIIDKLLIHYSKKPSSYEPGKLRKKSSRSRHPHHGVHDVGESPRNGSEKESQITPPARSVSLPHDHSGPSSATKVFARAASFQPERSDGARHVHPKLPDYDDLAARFAVLRGR